MNANGLMWSAIAACLLFGSTALGSDPEFPWAKAHSDLGKDIMTVDEVQADRDATRGGANVEGMNKTTKEKDLLGVSTKLGYASWQKNESKSFRTTLDLSDKDCNVKLALMADDVSTVEVFEFNPNAVDNQGAKIRSITVNAGALWRNASYKEDDYVLKAGQKYVLTLAYRNFVHWVDGKYVDVDGVSVYKVRAGRADISAELDGQAPINAADEVIEETVGAVIAVNNDDDDRDQTLDVDDGIVGPTADPRSKAEDDLKKFTVSLKYFPDTEGSVVLRRSNGKIRVYSDPKKGNTAPNDYSILWSATSSGFNAATEGNGMKTWNLANAGDRSQFQALVTNGIWVEGVQASASSRRDTEISLEYIPQGAAQAADKDTVKITVLLIEMDFVFSRTELTGQELDPAGAINQIPNPAVIVTEATANENNVAKLILKTTPSVDDDEDLITWEIENQDGQASFFTPAGGAEDKTGKLVRVYGVANHPGRVLIKAKVKAADNPYILYNPLVAAEKQVSYRCNFFRDVAGGQSAILPGVIPDVLGNANRTGVANVILRQAGIRLVPDGNKGVDGLRPTSTTAFPIAAGDGGGVITSVFQWFSPFARIRLRHPTGNPTEVLTIGRMDRTTAAVEFPVGNRPVNAYPAGSEVTLEYTTADPAPDVPGCRIVDGLSVASAATPPQLCQCVSMVNNRDGVLNLNFSTNPAPSAVTCFTPAHSLATPVTPGVPGSGRIRVASKCENQEVYNMRLLPSRAGMAVEQPAPFTIPPKDFISAVVFSGLSGSPTNLAVPLTHEFIHGCAVAHRTRLFAVPAGGDEVGLDEIIPVNLTEPRAGSDGCATQNLMYPTPAVQADLDVMQAMVARLVNVMATNPGNLTVTPAATSVYLASAQSRTDFIFTVKRNNVAVPNANVAFSLTYTTPSCPFQITSAVSVATDASGEAKVSFKAIGNLGEEANLVAVVTEGADTSTSSVALEIVPTVSFTAATSKHNENAGAVNVEVKLSAAVPAGKTVTVNFARSGGDAQTPADYTLAASPLTFAPGEDTKNIVVTLVDGNTKKGDKTLQLTLTAPATGHVLAGAAMVHTMTIVDVVKVTPATWSLEAL